jgi:hypothetical protein
LRVVGRNEARNLVDGLDRQPVLDTDDQRDE